MVAGSIGVATAEALASGARIEEYIVRTGPLMGKQDGFLSEIVRGAKSGGLAMGIMGYGSTMYQPLHVSDFSRAMVQLFDPNVEAPAKGVFNLGGPETTTPLSLVDEALSKAKRFKFKFHAPLFVLKFLAGMSGDRGFKERVALLFDQLAIEKNEIPKLLGESVRLVPTAVAMEEVFACMAK